MSDGILIQANFNINGGKLNDLEAVVAKSVEIAQQETGCQVYEIWKSDDGATLHWFEQYRDSDAVMAHLRNMEGLIPELMACVTPTGFTMYGPATEKLRAAVEPFGMTHMASTGGFTR